MTRLLVVADRSPPQRLADAVMGRHSSARYAGAMPCRHWYTVAATQNWIRSVTSSQWRSCVTVNKQALFVLHPTGRWLMVHYIVSSGVPHSPYDDWIIKNVLILCLKAEVQYNNLGSGQVHWPGRIWSMDVLQLAATERALSLILRFVYCMQ